MNENPADGLSADYLKINPLAQIPTFEGQDGYILTESVAIAIYRKSEITQHPPYAMMKHQYTVIPV